MKLSIINMLSYRTMKPTRRSLLIKYNLLSLANRFVCTQHITNTTEFWNVNIQRHAYNRHYAYIAFISLQRNKIIINMKCKYCVDYTNIALDWTKLAYTQRLTHMDRVIVQVEFIDAFSSSCVDSHKLHRFRMWIVRSGQWMVYERYIPARKPMHTGIIQVYALYYHDIILFHMSYCHCSRLQSFERRNVLWQNMMEPKAELTIRFIV